jgi:hypothetical protein
MSSEDMNAKTKVLFTTVAESQGVQIAQLEEQLGRLNVALGSLETKVEGDMQVPWARREKCHSPAAAPRSASSGVLYESRALPEAEGAQCAQ